MVQVNFNTWGDRGFQPRPFDSSKPTFVITHGYRNTGGNAANDFMPAEWISNQAQALRDRNPDANIIVVDWENGAHPGIVLLDYSDAARNTRDVGSQLAQELIRLGANPNTTELIGHSLGAHVSGFAGAAYREQTGNQLALIVGLDAAKLEFEGQPPENRLDTTDAQRVVGVHTTKLLGDDDEYGHADFYINSDDILQPGSKSVMGNHSYPTDLYTDLTRGNSILQDNGREFNIDSLRNEFGRIEIDTKHSIFVGTTSGQFSTGSNRLSLGSPEFASFVQFDGTPFRTVTDRLFNLGELTYRNGVTEQGSQPQGILPLDIAVSLLQPVSNTQTFTFGFNNVATPNDTGDPVLDGDRLRFSDLGLSSERIEALGTEYTLDLLGFSEIHGFSVIGQFNAPENSTANANLFGKITVAESRIIDPLLWEKTRSNVARMGIGFLEGLTFQLRALTFFLTPRFARSSNSSTTTSVQEEVFKITEEIAAQFPGGVFGSNERDLAIGSFIEDFIFGDKENDFLASSIGDDIILGGDGDDELYGGKDDDIVNGNRGHDFVSGDLGNDFIRGGQDNDTLMGGDGDDVLVGDKGINLLTGGLGADVFILRTDTGEVASDPSAADQILDLNALEGDRIGITEGFPIDILSYTSVDINQNGIEDTVIQYTETNEIFGSFTAIFGVAIDVAPDIVRGAVFSVPVEEPLLNII